MDIEKSKTSLKKLLENELLYEYKDADNRTRYSAEPTCKPDIDSPTTDENIDVYNTNNDAVKQPELTENVKEEDDSANNDVAEIKCDSCGHAFFGIKSENLNCPNCDNKISGSW